jgi:hypothetical protein
MAAALRGFTIGLCWAVVGVSVLAWMAITGPLAGLSFLCLVAAALFIVVAPFVHVGIYYVRGSHGIAAACTGFGILGVLVVLTMTGMFNFT